jgi:hypothetical protein
MCSALPKKGLNLMKRILYRLGVPLLGILATSIRLFFPSKPAPVRWQEVVQLIILLAMTVLVTLHISGDIRDARQKEENSD